jgi:hypothetical protein
MKRYIGRKDGSMVEDTSHEDSLTEGEKEFYKLEREAYALFCKAVKTEEESIMNEYVEKLGKLSELKIKLEKKYIHIL